MKQHLLSSVIVATVSFVVLSAPARANDEQMLDACIQHFIATNLDGYQGKVIVHKDFVHYVSSPFATPHHSEVIVSAADPAHGTELASVVCRLDRYGKVISMTSNSRTPSKLSQLIKSDVVTANATD